MSRLHAVKPQTSNALTQLAGLYAKLEDLLRGYARLSKYISFQDIVALEAIQGSMKDKHQVSNVLKSLVIKGFVTAKKDGVKSTYQWNLSAPAFTITQKQIRRAAKKPSSVEVIKPPSPVMESLSKATKEIEVVMGGITVIVGINPATGRARIVIEEA